MKDGVPETVVEEAVTSVREIHHNLRAMDDAEEQIITFPACAYNMFPTCAGTYNDKDQQEEEGLDKSFLE